MDILITVLLGTAVTVFVAVLILSFGGYLMARLVWGTMVLGAFLAKLLMAATALILLFVLLKYAGGI